MTDIHNIIHNIGRCILRKNLEHPEQISVDQTFRPTLLLDTVIFFTLDYVIYKILTSSSELFWLVFYSAYKYLLYSANNIGRKSSHVEQKVLLTN